MRKAIAVIVTIAALLFGAQALVVSAAVNDATGVNAAPNPQATTTATADADETATTGADEDATATATTGADEDATATATTAATTTAATTTAATTTAATTTAPGSLPNTGATTSYPMLILLGVVLLTLGLGVIVLLSYRRSARL